MAEAISIDRVVGAVAEKLLSVSVQEDPAAAEQALKAPVLQEANQQHRGLANIHLAFAFARLLSQECPSDARDDRGVPRMSVLVGDGIESRGQAEAYIAANAVVGRAASMAASKASNARFADAIPLAQEFIRVWTLTPGAVPSFVHLESARSPMMVDDVWGVLWQACAAVRSVQA